MNKESEKVYRKKATLDKVYYSALLCDETFDVPNMRQRWRKMRQRRTRMLSGWWWKGLDGWRLAFDV